jgi:hypothetical protein
MALADLVLSAATCPAGASGTPCVCNGAGYAGTLSWNVGTQTYGGSCSGGFVLWVMTVGEDAWCDGLVTDDIWMELSADLANSGDLPCVFVGHAVRMRRWILEHAVVEQQHAELHRGLYTCELPQRSGGGADVRVHGGLQRCSDMECR